MRPPTPIPRLKALMTSITAHTLLITSIPNITVTGLITILEYFPVKIHSLYFNILSIFGLLYPTFLQIFSLAISANVDSDTNMKDF